MANRTREDLLALTPGRYLADGYLTPTGQPRGDLSGDFAVAAATQLRAADLPAQELAFTVEALRALLAGQDGPAPEVAREAAAEALATVARMIRQPNNKGLVTWLSDCVGAIRAPADIAALMTHLQAVARLYIVIASLPEPEPSSPSSSASP